MNFSWLIDAADLPAKSPASVQILRLATTREAMLAGVAALAMGCSSRPPAFSAPDVDGEAAAEQAFELYDANGDGLLNEAELAKCPGVLEVLTIYDANGDKTIDKTEMAQRMEAWAKSPAMMSLNCRVTLDGRALEGAKVVYEPEPYVADYLPPAEGTTKPDGTTTIGIAADKLSPAHRGVKALNAGVYKIRITHPTISIRPEYNTETTLGREISAETRVTVDDLKVKSK